MKFKIRKTLKIQTGFFSTKLKISDVRSLKNKGKLRWHFFANLAKISTKALKLNLNLNIESY